MEEKRNALQVAHLMLIAPTGHLMVKNLSICGIVIDDEDAPASQRLDFGKVLVRLVRLFGERHGEPEG